MPSLRVRALGLRGYYIILYYIIRVWQSQTPCMLAAIPMLVANYL